MKYKTLAILFLLVTLFGGWWNNRCSSGEGFCGVVDRPIENVKKAPLVFRAKCATCHNLNRNGTGPALIGILDRAPYPEWMQEFVTNQDSLIGINEPYTRKIMEWSVVRFNHNFEEITEEEIGQLQAYFLK